MKILGIETSCDETAAAIVEDGTKVLSNVIASQIPLHHATGGVVPEVAAREHVVKIMPVIEETLSEADLSLDEIDGIAVTQGPGLLSSLVIGVCAASTLSIIKDKPLIPVNHIAGHIYANWLDENPEDPIQFPLIVLTVSGGHNELVLMNSHTSYELIGETLDDAAGEAFDKVARLLGLGYPGGPHVSRKAEVGNAKRFQLPRVYLEKDSFNFSFSGLKTAVLNLVKQEHSERGELSEEFIVDCAASFQENVCEILSDKLLAAAEKYCVKEVHLAGGVSANKRLREIVTEKIENGFFCCHKGKPVKLSTKPTLRYAKNLVYCTDNAAMIASAAFFHYQESPDQYLKTVNSLADPNLRMYD
ncbi:tRNA (adenosine(37)-N6)-threonylcarbamoyltransferase complex transferase subunit TsaD [Pseudomonadota bacterium]